MGVFLAALIIFIVGLVFLIIGLVAIKRAKTAQLWPIIPGRVIRSSVVEHHSSDGDGGSSVTYEPLVEYEYNVMGQTFTSRRVAYGANRLAYKKAIEIVERYPTGTRVNVHYNPDKAKEATLETSASGGKLFPIIGGVFAALGLIGMLVSLYLL